MKQRRRIYYSSEQRNLMWDSEIVYGNANLEIALDPDFALLFSRASSASADIADFNEAEQAKLYIAVRAALQFAQAQWWLWQSGSLPNELWEIRSRWAKNFIESPVINSIWQAELKQHIFSERFAVRGLQRYAQCAFPTICANTLNNLACTDGQRNARVTLICQVSIIWH